jgi:hypothetical protein
VFYSPTTGINSGTFTTGGADSYVGTTPVSTAVGVSGSGGASFYFTNAQSVQQLSGPFLTSSFDIGVLIGSELILDVLRQRLERPLRSVIDELEFLRIFAIAHFASLPSPMPD